MIIFQKESLKRHKITVHEGRKDFRCDQCHKAFGLIGSLRQHKKLVHEGRKDYRCSQCEMVFGQKSNLDMHVINVHKNLFMKEQNLINAMNVKNSLDTFHYLKYKKI